MSINLESLNYMLLTEQDIRRIRNFYPARGHNNSGYDDIGFGFLHYAYIRNLKPERILVVGSQRGFVPAICGLAAKHNGVGHVHFVDAGLDQKVSEDNKVDGMKSWGGVGIWKTATKDYWRPLDLQDTITIHNMTTEAFAKEIEDWPVGCDFGYAYIDGDHSFEGVKRDFELFSGMMEAGGIMTFHDVCVDKQTDWGECGVKRFWEEYMPKYEAINRITINKDCGLGIIQL